MNKLSWREPEEVNTLDTALVSLGFTYHIDTVLGIEGEVFVIDNYKGKKGGVFVIKEDSGFGLDNINYQLYQIIPKWETNFTKLEFIIKDLKNTLRFFGN